MSAYEGTPSLGYLIALNRSPLTCHSLRTSILTLSCAAMIGQTLGHYQILEKIGACGMGEVYRAQDLHLRRDVAIKVLPAGVLADDHARKRFRKEAEALSKLNHPNIQTVHDFSTEDGIDFLVTEYVPGVTLSERLVAKGLPLKEVLSFGQQMAEGLAAAHEQGIVHRDVKPSNLRITPDGRLKILDFGVAKLGCDTLATQTLTETHSIVGTPLYWLPSKCWASLQTSAATFIRRV